MSSQRISKEAEARIIGSIEKASELVKNGANPNDAIVKVASDSDLPVGHVRLMIHAYNTGQTNMLRKTGSSLFEKSANFPVANPAVILEKLYPTDVKQASAAVLAPDNDYERAPSWLKDCSIMEKAASAPTALVEKAPMPYPRDESLKMARVLTIVPSLDRERDTVRSNFGRAVDKVAEAVDKLDYYFKVAGRQDLFDSIRKNSEAMWGKPATILMGKIAQANPFIVKATAKVDYPFNQKAEPYVLVKTALAAVDTANQAKQALQKFDEEANSVSVKLAEHFRDQATLEQHPSILAGLTEKKALLGMDFTRPFVAGMGLEAGRNALQKVGPIPDDKLKTDALLALEDPAHEARLRGIRAQATLHDMMANDDFISNEDPQHVAKLYNEIVKLSPRAADQPMLMRSLIHRYLAQGQVDPHDVDQLVGIETKMKMRDEPSKEIHLPKVPGPNLVTKAPSVDEVKKVTE